MYNDKQESLQFVAKVNGHLSIKDDLDNVYVDKNNAIHPQNMARVFARALANEDNFFIHRMAFGNGGTMVNEALRIIYKKPNDGQGENIAAGWESRLYNETYSEIVDDSNTLIGSGEGADPTGDPESQAHVSGPGVRSAELGLTSQVVIEVVLNPGEPFGQDSNDSNQADPDSVFTFDEIGLFTAGLPPTQTPGYQDVNVGTKTSTAVTGLAINTTYEFRIQIDGGSELTVSIVTPAAGSGAQGEILYSDLINLINAVPGFNATAMISNPETATDPENQINTYGFLRFQSNTSGANSSINLTATAGPTSLFTALAGYQGFETAVSGSAAGVANDAVNPQNQRERMLTHITFSPVLKAANRSLIITYTLTVSLARSIS